MEINKQNTNWRDFPGGPVGKTLCSQCRGPGSTPAQGTRSHMPQLKIPQQRLKTLCATIKTWCGQINIKKNKNISWMLGYLEAETFC